MKKQILFYIIILLIAIPSIFAEDIIINSEDWRDVYSATLYGSLTDVTTNFLVSDKHGALILNAISKSSEIRIFSSKKDPFIVGYESIVRSKGYTVDEVNYERFNLELAELLNINNFIVIDDSYGYNAISVAPYAAVSNSYVIFADRTNIKKVNAFLEDQTINQLLIYGIVDREVRETLQQYNPEIINKEGDRFENNIEIVKKYQEIKESKQVILTNGEFIEKEIMSGVEPVIFIGSNNVPNNVKEYIQGSAIDIGVLIGNELVGTATTIRRQVGISVFVKFAQGARATEGAISQVEALDMFYLPTYILNIELDDIKYNKATDILEVSIRNTEEQALYLKGTYSLTDSEEGKQTVGDINSVFLDGNELKTFTYDVEKLPEGDIKGEVYILYGESKISLEKILDDEFEVSTIEIFDRCDIDIENLVYSKTRKSFLLDVINLVDFKCYVDVELIDIFYNDELITLGSEEVVLLDAL
jgi:hypothetical protein